jgi:zinc transport system substrate-binding protein
MICLAAGKLPVFVSIVPQKYFVQQIGKDLVEVQAMVRPGSSPATYEPKPQQMAGLSRAKIYFAIGVPFENAWLEKIADANPNMRVIHTDHGIEKRPMAAHHPHHDGQAENQQKVNSMAMPPMVKTITNVPALIPTSGCHRPW